VGCRQLHLKKDETTRKKEPKTRYTGETRLTRETATGHATWAAAAPYFSFPTKTPKNDPRQDGDISPFGAD
jgi:hypothetical protein